MASLGELVLQHPEVRAIVEDTSLGHTAVADRLAGMGHMTSERAVRRARRAMNFHRGDPLVHTEPSGAPAKAVAAIGGGKADISANEVVFHGVVLDMNAQDAEDWTPIFKIFGLSAEHFVIVDDTVKITTWQQSKGLDDGTRDKVQLWSHSARFKRIAETFIRKEVRDTWRESLLAEYANNPAVTLAFDEVEGTYVMLVADPQLGKKGTKQARENWIRGVEGHIEQIRVLIAAGRAPEAVHIAFMGDEHEGVANNYTNQPHTVELNMTGQMEMDYDLRVWTIREVAKLGLPMSVSSVISNHGEWTRNGGKDVVTTRGDNSSTFIARLVKKLFDELEPFGGPSIDWHIGDSDPALVLTLSGVKCYFTHGYIEKGKGGSTEIRTKSAMERQILGRTEELHDVQIFFTAHYHHSYDQEFEGRTLFGCPALEAEKSSEYMRDQFGVWSPPGMLGLLVTGDRPRPWLHKNVF